MRGGVRAEPCAGGRGGDGDASCTARAPRLRANPRAALSGRKEILILGKGRARPLPRRGEGAAGGRCCGHGALCRAGLSPAPPFPAPSSFPRRPSPRTHRALPELRALRAPPGGGSAAHSGGCSAGRPLGVRPGALRDLKDRPKEHR